MNMNNTEIKKNLEIVMNALNNVEVKGMQNLSNIVGSINILQQVYESIEPPEEK